MQRSAAVRLAQDGSHRTGDCFAWAQSRGTDPVLSSKRFYWRTTLEPLPVTTKRAYWMPIERAPIYGPMRSSRFRPVLTAWRAEHDCWWLIWCQHCTSLMDGFLSGGPKNAPVLRLATCCLP